MKWILTDREVEAIERAGAEKYKESVAAKNAAIEALIAAREKCDVYFDFNDENIVVFSVERVDFNTEKERTIVGYYLRTEIDTNPKADGQRVVREWTLICSRRQHNDLISLFNESKKRTLKV